AGRDGRRQRPERPDGRTAGAGRAAGRTAATRVSRAIADADPDARSIDDARADPDARPDGRPRSAARGTRARPRRPDPGRSGLGAIRSAPPRSLADAGPGADRVGHALEPRAALPRARAAGDAAP